MVHKLPLGWEMRGNQPFIGGLIPAKLTTTIIELNQKNETPGTTHNTESKSKQWLPVPRPGILRSSASA